MLQSGKELLTFTEHTDVVWRVAFNPDGKRLASASGDSTVKVWDAQTGKVIHSLPALPKTKNRQNFSVAFSPDGKRLASEFGDKKVKVWDAQTGEALLSLEGSFERGAFSPDGKRLASDSSP